MRIRLRYVVGFVAVSALSLAQVTPEPVWRTKPPAQWTADDARQILIQSPWAREIEGGVAGRLSEDQLREGGQMGQPTGVGYEGLDPKGSGPKVSPNVFTGPGGDDRSARSLPRGITLRIIWESAMPVKLAELKSHTIEPPTLDAEGYEIAVYGVPGPAFNQDPQRLGEPLKQGAVLRREGKKDARPIRAEVFQRPDGLAVVYVFPMSAEISPRDQRVEFDAHIGRVRADYIFDLNQMEFMGKLEL